MSQRLRDRLGKLIELLGKANPAASVRPPVDVKSALEPEGRWQRDRQALDELLEHWRAIRHDAEESEKRMRQHLEAIGEDLPAPSLAVSMRRIEARWDSPDADVALKHRAVGAAGSLHYWLRDSWLFEEFGDEAQELILKFREHGRLQKKRAAVLLGYERDSDRPFRRVWKELLPLLRHVGKSVGFELKLDLIADLPDQAPGR